uniref:hypothetical protein n=1 Tax=Citrobacter youngae TaxID=133448 RepID=UPI0019535074
DQWESSIALAMGSGNPGVPSLREAVAGVLGVDYDRLRNDPGVYDEALGMTYAAAADIVYVLE